MKTHDRSHKLLDDFQKSSLVILLLVSILVCQSPLPMEAVRRHSVIMLKDGLS